MRTAKTTKLDERWNLIYNEYDPKEEKLREALTTVGNGYFGTRGCMVCERDSESHYPGTYIAGVYNRLPSMVHGKEILNDDFVNCPNWLLIEFKIGRAKNFIKIDECEILEYQHALKINDALYLRSMTIKDKQGRTTKIEEKRFASMANMHYGVISLTITPLDYSEKIQIRSSIDGTVTNNGVARYRNLESEHLTLIGEGELDDGIFCNVETVQSHIIISVCAKHEVYNNGKKKPIDVGRKITESKGFVSETLTIDAKQGERYRLEKLVSMATSRDENIASSIDAARALLSWATTFDDMFKDHQKAWKDLWYTADVRIDGDTFSQKVLRLHTYHLLCTNSLHNINIDAGMPARGLHGEAYRGHIFWDSLYVLPFYFTHFPEVARSALKYRYRRLDAARNYARENGYEGAMFPWQSSDDGQEETQVIHYNPVSGKWDPDLSCRQRHVSIAIFYNIWEYYEYTADIDFIEKYGAEMLIEIARFWASTTNYSKRDNRYHIKGVMGPDEFHEKYPWSDKPGIIDNAYTNLMVVWVLMRASELVDRLPAEVRNGLIKKINFQSSELDKWKDITRKMAIPFADDGLIEQYDGYSKLKDLDWDHYREKYGNIHRLDRILKAEGDSPDNYKLAKQADVLMLFYVLPSSEIFKLLKRLGYSIKNKPSFMNKLYAFYEDRTSHGSTLSKIVHAAISREMSTPEKMWSWFMEALKSDVEDSQGGTTLEGIHCGVMAGTLNIVSRVMAGIQFSNGRIDIDPMLPKHWTRLQFKKILRGVRYKFEITQKNITVGVDTKGDNPLIVNVNK